jgi:uncharacterized protein (TIGR03437 family)
VAAGKIKGSGKGEIKGAVCVAVAVDASCHRVRKVSASGVISTVAGNGIGGDSGDGGQAINAEIDGPIAVAADSAGNLYIADDNSNKIRKVSATGVVTTVAGNGTAGYSGDGGAATSAQINRPGGVAVDQAGNVYIADNGNARIRKVSSNGVITTVAGNGTNGYSGDGGAATSAKIGPPNAVTVDQAGNLYISDGNVRKVSASGIITTSAQFGGPYGAYGVAVDKSGNLYVAEYGNGIVQRVSPNGTIMTIAGTGGFNYSGDGGPAISAQLWTPYGIAVDSAGNVYVACPSNDAVRLLQPTGPGLSVTNGASNLSSSGISPGEIVVLYGSGLGPPTLVSATVGSDGLFDKQLAGTTVSFNGIAAPMIYTWTTQVSAIVPYGITGTTAQVTVSYQGQTTASMSVPIASSAPGIFTLNSTGTGPGAVVNQDGSINTPATPAKIGDIISIYATGEGQTLPMGVDGKPASIPLPQPILPVTVTIGGQSVKPQYAGGAFGEVAGLLQINVQIPSGIQTGIAVPVVVQVGGVASQAGLTIAVQ